MILTKHRLSAAVVVQPSMVEHLLGRLRKSPDGELVADLTAPLGYLLSAVALPTGDWDALFSTDPRAGLDVMVGNPRVLDLMSAIELAPDALRTLGLCAAIRAEAPCAALALALLVVEDEEAHHAYRELGTGAAPLPQLPMRSSLPRERLRALGHDPNRGHLTTGGIRRVLESSAVEGVSVPVTESEGEKSAAQAVGTAADSGEDQGLAMRLDAAAQRWAVTADACRRSLGALESGSLPQPADLAVVEDLVDDAELLADESAQALGRPVAPSSSDLALAAEEVRNALAQATGLWLRELAGIAVPEDLPMLGAPAAEVRRIAAGVLGGADVVSDGILNGLRALHRLLVIGSAMVGGDSTDVAEVSELIPAATTRLPAELRLLVTLASHGRISLGEPEHETRADPDPEAAFLEPSATAVVESPQPTAPAPDESARTPEDTAGAGDTAGAEDTADAAVFDLSNVDLSDLDAMLAEPVPALRASRKRDPEPVPPETSRTALVPVPCHGANEPAAHAADLADLGGIDGRLLAVGRFGLAADLCEASGKPEASVAARRLGALAVELRSATGDIATAFAEEAVNVNGLTDDRSGMLVAWASAVRVAVMAPSIGAAGLILEFEAGVTGHPGLLGFGEAFADASRAGLVVAPAVSATVSTIAVAEREAAAAARSAGVRRQNAAVRTVKYIPANAVYQAWMEPQGVLGRLLTDAESNDHTRAESVRGLILALRSRGQVDREIDSTFADQRKQVPGRAKIIAGARTTLRQRYSEALDAAQQWTDAVARADEARVQGRAVDDWQTRPYERLRERINAVKAQVLDELAAGDPDAAWPALARLVREAMRIGDGSPPVGRETTAVLALHAELLGSDLTLTLPAIEPDAGFTDAVIPALVALATAPRRTVLATYEARAALGEHDVTDLVVQLATARDETLADELAGRRRDAVQAGAAKATETIDELSKNLNVARMTGTLSEEAWSGLAARAVALRYDKRNNFRRILSETSALVAEAAQWRDRSVSGFIAKLEKQALDDFRVESRLDMLRKMAVTGNLASAEELLDQISAGRVLPVENVGDDSFSTFFPVVPEYAADHPALLTDLRAMLRGGSGRAEAVGRLAGAGLVPADLGADRAKRAEAAIHSWIDLRNRTSKVDVTTLLRAVLGEAGLEFKKAVKRTQEQGRTGYVLSGVTGTGDALTPEFGSRMSPSGSTLRVLMVHKAQTPATLIEWLRGDPSDQTVLVLWLTGKALSAKDRRAMGEAAKSRPKPTVLVLDEAALAFLACQPEPRRSTFEAISRPFTGASPYADTPGDTAPEMFYGRLEELEAVIDLQGPSIFYGGRQLGKSALLRMAQRRFDDAPDNRAVLASIFTVGADANPEKLWRDLWPKLAEVGVVQEVRPTGDLAELTHDAIVAWIKADEHRSLLVMLDEADAFLEADAEDNRFTHVDWWRKIRDDSDRRVKVVFAGLHRTARFDSLSNQPLGHLLNAVLVGPLGPQPAHNLLVRPLAALGYRFEDPIATPARVLAQANNMPALLQLFGAALVSHLSSRAAPVDQPWSLITDEDVDAVFANADLSERFRDKYVLTLNLDHRYMVIAYLVALSAYERGLGTSMTLQELYDRAEETWPAGFAECRFDGFRGLVDECIDLGILAVDAGRYRMRTPTVQRLLGTDIQLMDALTDADAVLVPPSKRDVASYRRPMGPDGNRRMPLTERQLGEVYRGRSRVLVVSGSAQLGAGRVLDSLEQVDRGGTQRLALHRLSSTDPRHIRKNLARAANQPLLAVADLRTATVGEVREFLAEGRDEADSFPDSTLALLVTEATAPAWIGHDARVDLSRVDSSGFRFWAEEYLPVFANESSRAEALAATGGWPMVLEAFVGSPNRTAPLSEQTALRFVESAGLAGPRGRGSVAAVLTEAFSTVMQLTDGQAEYEDEIRMFLDDEEPLADLADEAGFDDVGRVLDTLLALDCLVRDKSGRIQPEPALSAALRLVAAS